MPHKQPYISGANINHISAERISIIILSWNTKQLLKQCLESLISNIQYPISNYEIIVVDNGSEDGSQEYLRDLERKRFRNIEKKKISKLLNSKSLNFYYSISLKVIFNKENLGFAKGNNQGIEVARGEYVMLLNSDTVVKKGALEKLVEFLDKNPQMAAASPMLLNLDGTPQIDYYMKFPNLWQIFLYHNRILRPIALKISFLRNKIVSSQPSHPRSMLSSHLEVDQLPGAALMARREVWDKVGLLDEDYQFLYEDVDWCYRAKKRGYKLVVVPNSKIVHIGGASWKKKLKESSFEFYRQFFSSMLLFVKKNYGGRRELIFKTALVLSFLLKLKLRLSLYFATKRGWTSQTLWE